MKAIYITYAIEDHPTPTQQYTTGQVVNAQIQTRGLAPKVADWPRLSWQSVVRYSRTEAEGLCCGKMSLLTSGQIDLNTHALLIGSQVMLEEDVENSTRCVDKIENE